MRHSRSRGIILVSVITMVIAILMLIAVLLKQGQVGLFQSSFYRDGVRASQAAKGGVNHLTDLLSDQHDFTDDVLVDLGDSRYLVTFDESEEHYSVNNLNNSEPALIPNSLGHEIAPHTADLMVVGTSGYRKLVVHVVLQRALGQGRGVAANGRVVLSGNVRVDGVKSLFPPPGKSKPEPAPGGILSKYRSTGPSDPAISWDELGGSTFSLSELSRLETAPAETGGQGLSDNLQTLFPDQSVRHGAADSIPDIDVSALVTQGMSAAALEPSGSFLQGYVYLNEERSVGHDLTVNGSISLSGGTLYVDGDLTVNGDIEGVGTIYASGDIEIRGGSALVETDRDSGAAILAGGNVNMIGLDASGYLRALSQAYSFEPSVDRLEELFSNYQGATAGAQFLNIAEDLGQRDEGHLALDSGSPRQWISPIPGPDGTHPYGRSNGATNRLATELKDHHPSLSTDRKARKVVKALEQVQYHFRDSQRSIRHNGEYFINPYPMLLHYFTLGDDYQLTEVGSTTPLTDVFFQDDPNLMFDPAWDDAHLEQKFWTHAHLGAGQDDFHRSRRDVFVAHNPLDDGWLGNSSFQGMVYARGNIRADGNFKIIGSVRSLGDVTLKNGSTLIYNEEYRDLMGAQLPLGLVHYEEL
jgi:hypothetical protein